MWICCAVYRIDLLTTAESQVKNSLLYWSEKLPIYWRQRMNGKAYRSVKLHFIKALNHKWSPEVHLKAEGRYRMKNHATSETCQESYWWEQQNWSSVDQNSVLALLLGRTWLIWGHLGCLRQSQLLLWGLQLLDQNWRMIYKQVRNRPMHWCVCTELPLAYEHW